MGGDDPSIASSGRKKKRGMSLIADTKVKFYVHLEPNSVVVSYMIVKQFSSFTDNDIDNVCMVNLINEFPSP